MTTALNDKLPIYRSMIYRWHQQNNADFNQFGLVKSYQQKVSSEAMVVDLTPLDRIGFKGRDTNQWLEAQKIELPVKPNQAVKHKDGVINARLSDNELLLLNSFNNDSKTLTNLRKWEQQLGNLCYKLDRDSSHCWLLLAGTQATYIMSKICGIDLGDEAAPQLSVAQTSVARVNSVVIKDTIKNSNAFHILGDSASIEFMWHHGLLDAIREFNGTPAGLDDIT